VSPAVAADSFPVAVPVPYQNPPARPARVTMNDQKNTRMMDKKALS
jgi:hypothetical protein